MGMFEEAARRRRAAEMQRRLAELDAWDRRYGLGGAPPGHPSQRPDTAWRHHSLDGRPPVRAFDPVPVGAHREPPHRPGRRVRRRGRGRLVLLLLATLLVAAAVTFPEQTEDVRARALAAGRSVLGLPATADEPGPQEPVTVAGDTAVRETPWWRDDVLGGVVDRWSPGAGSTFWGWEPPRGTRVLPPVEATTTGSFAFLQTQPDDGAPVGFSPCGSIPVEVNPDGAPDDYAELVLASLGRVGAAAGLDLVLVGETDDVWREEPRELGAPVLVSWADSDTVPALAGSPAGLGGATYVTGPDGLLWHASGQVVLDRRDLTRWEQHAAVLDHELAHVLGLDHVADRGELMAAVNSTGRVGFGPGDLAGLAAVGAIACPGE